MLKWFLTIFSLGAPDYTNTYITISTNNPQDIFLIKQLHELTLSNQTGQTQKWVSFQKKVLTRLFQYNISGEESERRKCKRLSLHKEEKKTIGKIKKS